MTTPIDAWSTWRSRVVGASQGGYRSLLVGHPAGQLGGSKRARGWWRQRTPIKMERCKWPWRRTAARPIAAAADDATRRRPPQDVCRPRRRRTWWSGVCGPRDALGRSPLLEQNFACAFAKNRDEKSMKVRLGGRARVFQKGEFNFVQFHSAFGSPRMSATLWKARSASRHL